MPVVPGVPDNNLSDADRYNLDRAQNSQQVSRAQLGEFLKALMQKLDADAGVSDNDFESIFTP